MKNMADFEMNDRVADLNPVDDDVDYETSFIDARDADHLMLPEPPVLTPQLGDHGDRLQNLRAELRDSELNGRKQRLVHAYYQAMAEAYELSPPTKIPYDQFRISEDGKTLYWKPEDGKEIPVSASRGANEFVALSTLAKKYGRGGAYAIRKSLGFEDYLARARKVELSTHGEKVVRHAAEALPEGGNLTPTDANVAIENTKAVAAVLREEGLTREQAAALATIDDPPMNTEWVVQARRELEGLGPAMTRKRDELVNNLAKLSTLDQHIGKRENHLARERTKLTETADADLQREVRERIVGLERELSDMRLEREARLEAASAIKEDLRTQINRVRETINRVLEGDKTLAERIRTLFREQGITIASILTAIGMTISTLVLALTGGGGGAAPTPPPSPPDKGGLREWAKKTLRALGRVLAKLAGKAAAALPGVIGSVVSWVLGLLAKTTSWLATNLWALVVAVGGLLFVAAREWLSKKPKRE